jgi:predicted GNAT family acetyltransferase
MRVLFDNGTPRGVATALTAHAVEEARSRGIGSGTASCSMLRKPPDSMCSSPPIATSVISRI